MIEFTTSSGLLLAQLENDCLELEEHDQTQTVGTRYTDQEIEEIELAILSESRRGNTARYSETTIHGDQLGPLTKGPLSIVDWYRQRPQRAGSHSAERDCLEDRAE